MNPSFEQPAPRLRPMNLGDILDAVFRIYRGNFLTFLGIVAVLQVPMIILQLLMTLAFGQTFASDLLDLMDELPRFDPNQDSFNQLPLAGIALFYVGSIVLALIQGLVVQQLIQGALTNAVSQRYLGRPISIGSAYSGVLGRLGSLIGAGLLLGLVGAGVALVVGGVIIGLALLAGGVFGGGDSAAAVGVLVGVLVLFVVVLLFIGLALLLVRFSFFTQAIIVEGEGAVGSLRRSWRLVGGSYWRVLGIILVVSLLLNIIVGIPSGLAGGVIGAIFADPVKHFVIRQTLSTLVGYLAQIIVLPVQLIAYTLLYFDLRVRNEGYDLELMAQQMSAAPTYDSGATTWGQQ